MKLKDLKGIAYGVRQLKQNVSTLHSELSLISNG
jgi:hypothetical protein